MSKPIGRETPKWTHVVRSEQRIREDLRKQLFDMFVRYETWRIKQ